MCNFSDISDNNKLLSQAGSQAALKQKNF